MPRKKHKNRLNAWWLRYEYKHTTLAILAIILFVVLIDSTLLVTIIRTIDSFGHVSGLIAGLMSVSFFTAAPALVLTVELAQHLDPFTLALLIALGSVVGDWLILQFFEERIFTELQPIFRKLRLHKAARALRRRSTRWILVLVGALFISSPLPDEVGLALMGISHFNRVAILLICFVLNMMGAFTIITAVRVLL